MDMRAIMTLLEGTADQTPAQKAIKLALANIGTRWGVITLNHLGDSREAREFKWPLEGDDWVILNEIEAHRPGRGQGTIMMEALVEACDKFGARIFADAQSYDSDGPRGEDLVKFYRGFGFVPYPQMDRWASGTAMMRLPKTGS